MLCDVLRGTHHDKRVDELLVQLRLHKCRNLLRKFNFTRSKLTIVSSELLKVQGVFTVDHKVNLKLLGNPVVVDLSSDEDSEDLGVSDESLSLTKSGFLLA